MLWLCCVFAVDQSEGSMWSWKWPMRRLRLRWLCSGSHPNRLLGKNTRTCSVSVRWMLASNWAHNVSWQMLKQMFTQYICEFLHLRVCVTDEDDDHTSFLFLSSPSFLLLLFFFLFLYSYSSSFLLLVLLYQVSAVMRSLSWFTVGSLIISEFTLNCYNCFSVKPFYFKYNCSFLFGTWFFLMSICCPLSCLTGSSLQEYSPMSGQSVGQTHLLCSGNTHLSNQCLPTQVCLCPHQVFVPISQVCLCPCRCLYLRTWLLWWVHWETDRKSILKTTIVSSTGSDSRSVSLLQPEVSFLPTDIKSSVNVKVANIITSVLRWPCRPTW